MNIHTWIATLPPLAELERRQPGLVEVAAERLGVTPDSLIADGMDAEWFSNPENMPPPPGSWGWVPSGHPLWVFFKDL